MTVINTIITSCQETKHFVQFESQVRATASTEKPPRLWYGHGSLHRTYQYFVRALPTLLNLATLSGKEFCDSNVILPVKINNFDATQSIIAVWLCNIEIKRVSPLKA